MGESPVSPEGWEAIEDLYRAGQLSIREIARQYGISEGAIRKKAREASPPWTRDLSQKVRQAVRTELVRSEVRDPKACEPEIVNAAAAVGVEVVRGHRKDLARLRRIADSLAGRLEAFLDLTARPETNDAEEREYTRSALQQLGHFLGERETPGDLLDKLAKTLHRVIPLERQAFNLDDPAEYNPASLVTAEQARRMAREVLNDGDGEEPAGICT